MTTDFSKPQRQSKTGILVLFFYTLIQYSKAFFPIFAIYFLKQNKQHLNYVVLSIAVIVVLVAIVSYLKFINFTFYLDQKNSQFIISEGILTKTITSIQISKIQQVNIDQSFLHKIIGTFELSVDTAGSSKNEGNIKAISKKMAVALKAKLLENENVIITNETIDAVELVNNNKEIEQISFLKIKLSTLIKVGLTSNYGKSLALILVFIVTIHQNFGQYLDYDLVGNVVENNKINSLTNKVFLVQLLLVFLALSLFVVIVVNLFRTIFKYFDYTVAKQNDSMLFSYGLLNSKNSIIKFNKVQIVSITRNYFQKKMRLSEIAISHASAIDQQQKDKIKSLLEIPGCNDAETSEILKQIFDTIPAINLQIKPNFRKLGFLIFIMIIVPIAIFYGLRYFVFEQLCVFDYFTFVYSLLTSLILFFGYRNSKLFLGTNFARIQSGAWDITNQFISIHKIQAITTSQLFWHKNLNIGTLKLHTAGGDLTFQLGNFKIIKEYVNIWLYKIETSNKNWM